MPSDIEKQKQTKPKKRANKFLTALMLLVIIALVLLDISMLLYCFEDATLTMALGGARNVELNVGTAYEDAGCEAILRGNNLFQNGYALHVTQSGSVDHEKTGVYELTYHARLGFWNASVKRSVTVVDREAPQITLVENPDGYVIPGEEYVEEGFSASDNYDGDLTAQVNVTRMLNCVVYEVEDSSGNRAEVVRMIKFHDPIPPEITLLGEEEMTLHAGLRFNDPGFEANDNLEGDLTDAVEVTGEINIHKEGTYTLTYSVNDKYGNTAQRTRMVTVTTAGQPEVIVPEGKVVYLTFDDGPGPYTEQLLDILDKYDVKATFFVCDTKYKDLIKDIVDRGHAVGIHTASHNYGKIYRSQEAYFNDLYKMQDIIEEISGVKTTLMRFPGGSSNEISNFNPGIMSYLVRAVKEKGLQYFDWNVNSGDAGLTKQKDKVVEYVIDGLREHDVNIVLQHDIKEYSVEAVEDIIIWALEHGYRFLPLDPSSPTSHHRLRN